MPLRVPPIHDHAVLDGQGARGVPPHQRGVRGHGVRGEDGAPAAVEVFEYERYVVFVYREAAVGETG